MFDSLRCFYNLLYRANVLSLRVFLFSMLMIVTINSFVFVVVVRLFLLVVLIFLSRTCLGILYRIFPNPIWFHLEEWNTTFEQVLVMCVELKLLFLLSIGNILVCLLVQTAAKYHRCYNAI